MENQVAIIQLNGQRLLTTVDALRQSSKLLANKLRTTAPIVLLKILGVSTIETVRAIERYLRTGDTAMLDINVENVVDIYSFSAALEMSSIADACREFVICRSSVEDLALIYFIECSRHSTSTDLAVQFLGTRLEALTQSRGFLSLSAATLKNLMNHPIMLKTPQWQRFAAIIRWIQHDCRRRNPLAEQLLAGFPLKKGVLDIKDPKNNKTLVTSSYFASFDIPNLSLVSMADIAATGKNNTIYSRKTTESSAAGSHQAQITMCKNAIGDEPMFKGFPVGNTISSLVEGRAYPQKNAQGTPGLGQNSKEQAKVKGDPQQARLIRGQPYQGFDADRILSPRRKKDSKASTFLPNPNLPTSPKAKGAAWALMKPMKFKKKDGAKSKGPKSKGAKSKGPKSRAAKSKGPKSKGPKSRAAKSKGPKSRAAKSKGPKSKAAKSKGPKSRAAKSKGPKSRAAKSKGPKSRVTRGEGSSEDG